MAPALARGRVHVANCRNGDVRGGAVLAIASFKRLLWYSGGLEFSTITKYITKPWVPNHQIKIIGITFQIMRDLVAMQNAKKALPHPPRKPEETIAKVESA